MSDWQPSPVLIDEDLDRPYEPWRPRIGQRVRVRLSGECQFVYPSGTKHFAVSDAAIGTILNGLPFANCDHSDHQTAHRYCVVFEPPVLVEQIGTYRHWLHSQCFAAIELEPLEEVPTAEQPAVASGA